MEQALVFASIIIGVAISDQVMSLHRLLRSRKTIRWHWAQPWFAAIVLMTDMMIWWAFASQRSSAPVSIGQFLPKIIELILLALLTLNSLPDDVAEDGVDIAAYYQRNARYQWLLLALAFLWGFMVDLVTQASGGTAVGQFLTQRLGDLVAIGLIVGMAFIRRWRGVAIGLALVSVAPILWLARTIG